jgi:hypothetical protein
MRRILIVLAAIGIAALAGPAAASAHHNGDRNHDGLPDRWEHKNHLSLKVNQANKDQDRDHLNNKQEFQDGTNPRKADTDNDGIKDGDEQEFNDDARKADTNGDGERDGADSGTIASFTNGVLTITLANGQSVSGQVTPATEIKCEAAENENEVENENETGDRAHAADHGGDDGSSDGGDNSGPGSTSSGPGSGEEPTPAPMPAPTGTQPAPSGENEQGDDNEQQATPCGQDALTPGTKVHEAELHTTAGGLVFDEVEVVK